MSEPMHPDGTWSFIGLPQLQDNIVNYAGITLYNPVAGVILNLLETPTGWEWKPIEECRNKAKPCDAVGLKAVGSKT